MVENVLWIAPYRAFPLAAGYFGANIEQLLPERVKLRVADYPRTTLEVDQAYVRDLLLSRPAVLGLSCFFWNVEQNLLLARVAKKLLPDTKVVLGGPSVGDVSDARRLLESHPQVDAAISGEADFAFPQFVASVIEGSDPRGIEGLVHRTASGLGVATAAARVGNVSMLPMVYDDENQIVANHVSADTMVTLETLRGCRRSCDFCLYAGPVRLMPVERVEREIEYLCERGVRRVRVADSHFGGSRKRALGIFASMERVNRCTTFTIYPDPAHVDREYLEAARAAGCRLLSFGVQSLDENVNECIGRRSELPKLERALSACRSWGHVPQVDLMFGLPGQDPESLIRDMCWLEARGVDEVLLSPLMLFPGTRLAEGGERSFETLELPQRFSWPKDSTVEHYAAFVATAAGSQVLKHLRRCTRLLERAMTACKQQSIVGMLLATAPRNASLLFELVGHFDAPAETQRRQVDRAAAQAVELLQGCGPGRDTDPTLLRELARIDLVHAAMRQRHRERLREGTEPGGTRLLWGEALRHVEFELNDDVWLEHSDVAARHLAPAGANSDAEDSRFVLDCRAGRAYLVGQEEYDFVASFRRPRSPFAAGRDDAEAALKRAACWCERGVLVPHRRSPTQPPQPGAT